MDDYNKEILEALVDSAEHLMSAKVNVGTFFGVEIGDVSPSAVEFLQRDDLEYEFQIENGHLQLWDGKGDLPTLNTSSLLGSVYAGEPNFLGKSAFYFIDHSSKPEGLKKELNVKNPNVNEALYVAFQSHSSIKSNLLGLKNSEKDGNGIAPAPVVDYFVESNFDSIDVQPFIEKGKELTSMLYEYEGLITSKFLVSGKRTTQRFIRSDGTRIS